VQSPEGKRRNISMTRVKDKKTELALLEKQHELQVKVAALKNIAKVQSSSSSPLFPWQVYKLYPAHTECGSVKALRTLKKEMDSLEEAQMS
jgi:hypothetical protein